MEIKTDFLVIGSGIAGLFFALKVAETANVAIITKKEIMDTSTNLAQGGIASVFGEQDSFDLHIRDTLESGAGLCNKKVAEMVVKNGPEKVHELIELGVRFNLQEEKLKKKGKGKDGFDFDLGREGGHSQNRILHSHDMTGKEIERVLVEKVKSHERISLFEDHIAIDLITYSTRSSKGLIATTNESYCCGAYVLDRENKRVKTFSAGITLLATGGSGKVYLFTSNPDIATGDGIAMGYRAGASVANLEFVQFHPTCLYHPEVKNFLISEAVRGEGGVILDSTGKAFMGKYDPQKDLACRDVVARAIDTELKMSGADSVFLDVSHKDSGFIKSRFPNLYEKCLFLGIDMTKEAVPVVPAAHYMCGGVATDMSGRTDVHKLYAIGETACTGLHGANRLASNSLLEALIYADRAAKAAVNDLQEIDPGGFPEALAWDDAGAIDSDEGIVVSQNWDEIRRFMWNYVGIVRSNRRLERAKRRIEIIQGEISEYYWDFRVSPDLIELRNIAMVAELIIRCATHRKESRGLHYNIEYPERNDKRWLKDTVIRKPFAAG